MFEDRLKKLRELSNLTQNELASKLGVTKQSVSNWENGNILPSIEMLVKIAKLFSVSTDYLLGMKTTSKTKSKEEKTEFINKLLKLIDDFKSE